MNILKSLLIVCLLGLGGCATPYIKSSIWNGGGYDDVQLAPNVFKVMFSGNDATSKERTQVMALLRAAEITINAGYTHFKVVDGSTDAKSSQIYIPGTTTTYISAYSFGNNMYGTANTNTMPSFMGTIEKPKTVLTIACQNMADNGAYDAAFLIKSLNEKYKLRRTQ